MNETDDKIGFSAAPFPPGAMLLMLDVGETLPWASAQIDTEAKVISIPSDMGRKTRDFELSNGSWTRIR